ncbi:YybH family protein [Rhodococcoides yunnanense]|uniref:YybH family protein n=1 Tax=Rhodococcoides yunnanense TaxID=278209 RepID=UPI0009353A6F|nr:SgcJ/EcaC family oxidoreductase [Rhodococcus yunnanensis]
MADEDDVRALLDVYTESAYAKDTDRFLTLFDQGVRIFDLWSTWEYVGLPAWAESVGQWFSSLGEDRVVVEFAEVEVTVGGDLASVSAFATYAAVSASGERLRQLQNRLTWVLVRREGRWLVTHEHTSAPVDDSGKVILARS